MQQYLTYLCIDINETGPSLVVFLRVDQLYVLRFLFCRVYYRVIALVSADIVLSLDIEGRELASVRRYPNEGQYSPISVR